MLCPSQCNVELTIRDDAKVVRVLARDNEEVDDGWLCDKGRFGYQSFGAPERITTPLMRIGGFLREASWERALEAAVAALERSGEDTVARVGGQATNEEGFLVQHLLRKGLGSPHVTSGPGSDTAGSLARALARVDLSARVSDIDHADAILVLDTELVDEAPILDLRVRKAVRRNQARLVVASSRPSTLDAAAQSALRFAPGAAEAALAALASALGSDRAGGTPLDELANRAGATTGFIPGRPQTNGSGPASGVDAVSAAADLLRDAGDVVIICGERVLGGKRGAQAGEALLAVAAALGVADRPESGLIAIPAETNGRGLREVGCSPTLGPGLADADAAGDPDSARGALLLLETDAPEAELARAASVIAFARFHDEALDSHADVVFPAEIYPEKEGTVTHPDGRVQRVRQALGRPGEVRPGWSVLASCASGLEPARVRSHPRWSARWWPRRCRSTPASRSTKSEATACAGRTVTRRRPFRRRALERAAGAAASAASRTGAGTGTDALGGPRGRVLALAALPFDGPARLALGRRRAPPRHRKRRRDRARRGRRPGERRRGR